MQYLAEMEHIMTENGAVYTHGRHSSVLRSHNNRTVENSTGYLMDALEPGHNLLDIGFGPNSTWSAYKLLN